MCIKFKGISDRVGAAMVLYDSYIFKEPIDLAVPSPLLHVENQILSANYAKMYDIQRNNMNTYVNI